MNEILTTKEVARELRRSKTQALPRSDPASAILTASEVALELRCSRSHVYNLMNGTVEGLTLLPHLALGRKKVVPRSCFENWKLQNITDTIASESGRNIVDADPGGIDA